jgi:beta-galactosidase
VDLPHDLAVELPFDASAFNLKGFKPVGRQFPATSVGWSRKTFDIPAADASRRLGVEFDGVFRNCTVWFNGHYLGRNESGYCSFRFDCTDYARFGEQNLLVVRVDASFHEGWFCEGAGLYRHVWLTTMAPVHVGHWGAFVQAKPGRGRRTTPVSVRRCRTGCAPVEAQPVQRSGPDHCPDRQRARRTVRGERYRHGRSVSHTHPDLVKFRLLFTV